MVAGYKNLTKVILLTLILVVLTANVSATSFTTDLHQIKARIMPGENALYNLTISNNDQKTQTYVFGLSAADAPNWVVTPNSLRVEPGSEETATLKVIPKSSTPIDTYILALRVTDTDEAEKIVGVPLILSLDGFVTGYKPNIALNPSFSGEQDPRDKFKLTLVMRNRNPADLESVKVLIESELFSKEYETSLGSLQEITKEFVFTLDPLQEPGDYKVTTKIIVDEKEIETSEKILTINRYSTVDPKSSTESSWFYTTETITLYNNGNYERIKEIAIEAPWTKRIFMSSEPEGIFSNEDGSKLTWAIDLKPTETKTVVITTNYRPLVIIILAIIVLIMLYYILRSPVIMLKEAAVVKQDKEGISEAKVRIFIKNRSRRAVHSVTITDRLPRITHLSESAHALGGLKPTKVTSTEKRGTIMYWDIDTLEPYEERIITYRMTSKLKVVGNLTLPKVTVKFDAGKGKERKVQSPVPNFTKK